MHRNMKGQVLKQYSMGEKIEISQNIDPGDFLQHLMALLEYIGICKEYERKIGVSVFYKFCRDKLEKK